MIGIKGTRGVGKTTFLLQYAKEKFGTDRSCLFINMNNFYFSGHSIVDFANEFQKRGGKVLLIDQVFKHPDWSRELRMCQPPRFFVPRISEPANRDEIPSLHTRRDIEQPRTDSQRGAFQSPPSGLFSRLPPSRLLPLLPRETQFL